MWLIYFAMKRPITIVITIAAIVVMSILAISRMKVDIFPGMSLPMVSVVQPYGGMSPAQMEGYLTSFYEQHFFYISGVDHVRSRSIQSASVIDVYFRPGTDMAAAMSEVVAQVDRSRAYMPPGTVNPFVLRFDVGNVPVGFLTFYSQSRELGEIQDLVFARVRPVVSTIAGVSTPPPFGANQRTIVVSVDNQKLSQYDLSPETVAEAVAKGNLVSPSGLVRVGGKQMLTDLNSTVGDIQDLGNIVIELGRHEPDAVYLKDLARISDSTDIPTGYALVNGKRAIYMAISKQSVASTLAVVNGVKKQIPYIESLLPEDIKVGFQFDQSKYVTEAISGLIFEAGLGAVLTGLMVLAFLRDMRSSVIVVLNIPIALLSALVALWATGESINIMTLGGLALAVGILVDEATVTIENIHSHLAGGKPLIRAVYDASVEVAVPQLLAMLAVVSVFVPSFFMFGIVRDLFVPLSLAVGSAMTASYFLSSTLVPILCCWLLRRQSREVDLTKSLALPREARPTVFSALKERYGRLLDQLFMRRQMVLCAYLLLVLSTGLVYPFLGQEIFPAGNPDSFQLRLKAPAGTRFDITEAVTKKVLEAIGQVAGRQNISVTIAYAGTQPPNYAISQVYMWTSGPEEAIVLVALEKHARVDMRKLQERLRRALSREFPDVTFGFEAGDIVNKIMNFGTATPIQVDVSGPDYRDDKSYARRLLARLQQLPYLRDVGLTEPLEYPSVKITVDRKRAGHLGAQVEEVGSSVADATYSSRFLEKVFWLDRRSGLAYQVQIQVPASEMTSLDDVGSIRVKPGTAAGPFLRDLASIQYGTEPGEYDHYNMARTISMTANIKGDDLGKAARLTEETIARLGDPPRGVRVKVRGQVPVMRGTFASLLTGVLFAAVAIFIMLVAYFQSFKLSLCIISVTPAVIFGALFTTLATGTTLNVQSFMGMIMATGIGVANAILVVVFAEQRRRSGVSTEAAAREGAAQRLRPVLMTTLAMVAGMVPMALGLSEGGERTAPLGRAVIGGLLFSTTTVLLILPLIYALVQRKANREQPDLIAEGGITIGGSTLQRTEPLASNRADQAESEAPPLFECDEQKKRQLKR